MQKRKFLTAAAGAVAALALSTSVMAQVVGKDYNPINPPQPTDNPAKIEVLEFFSYGCIHCYHFHPAVKKWAAKLPADVEFKRVPVSFGRNAWFNLNRLYYALEASGEMARLDDAAFAAIHDKNVKLFDEAAIKAWVAQEKGDSKKFADAFDSFGVQSKAKRADQISAAYKVQGTPTIAVDGRYMVINDGDWDAYLAKVDRMIAKARSERRK